MTRPCARLRCNGVEITTELIGEEKPLISLTITDEVGLMADTLDLTLDNRPVPPKSRIPEFVPQVGDIVEVWLGYEPQPAFMGKYRVDSWELSGPREVVQISASSAELTTEIKETKTRSWHDTTVGEIVGKIAGEHDLEAAVSEDQASREIEHIDQQGESDMGFLTRLAKRNGANFKIANGKVIFATAASDTLPTGQPNVALVITPRDVSTWSFSQAERGGHKSVITYYHDHDKGKRVAVTAGSGKPAHRDRKLYRSKAEAEEAGKAKLGELTRGRMEANFDGVGNPELFAGGKVKMADFNSRCDGGFYVRTVTHSFSTSGFTSSASLETEKSEPVAE